VEFVLIVPKYYIAGMCLLLWFIAIKQTMEIFGIFTYFMYFLPIIVIGILSVDLDRVFKYKIKRGLFYFLCIFLIFLLKDLIRFDYDGVLEQIKFFLGFIFLYYFSKKFPITTIKSSSFLLLFLLVPLIYALLAPSIRLELIPNYLNNFHIFIESIHYTAKMFVFILLIVLWRISEKSSSNKIIFHKLRYLALITSILFMIFYAGSRAAMLASIFILSSFVYYRNRRLGIDSILLVLLFLFVSFFAPIFLHYIELPEFIEHALKMNRDDISSGRIWLQMHHFSLFENNWLWGVPAEVTDFRIGDIIDGVRADAGGESMYTKLLAREGIWGAIKLFIFLFMVLYPVAKKNLFGFIIGGTIVILNASLALMSNCYSMFYIFYLWLYFSILFDNRHHLMH
jgi:hypothetical protein